MSILKNKMIREATDPKEAQIDNSLYMIDVDIDLSDAIAAQRLLRFATKRNVSIQVYTTEDVQNGAILVGARSEVQRVYKKFWSKDFDDDLEMFKEDIKKYRPKVYYEYTVTLDIMKITPKVCSELLQAGVIIRDYNDDKKTARLLGPKTKVAEVARIYFDKSDFDRSKIEKIKEAKETNRLRMLSGIAQLTESYEYEDEEIEPQEVTFGDDIMEAGASEFKDLAEATDFISDISTELSSTLAKLGDERLMNWMRATEQNFDAPSITDKLYDIVSSMSELREKYDSLWDELTELG